MFASASGLQVSNFLVIEALGTPQPYATFSSPLELTGATPPDLRLVAIFCTDGDITLEVVRALIARDDPRAAAFITGEWEFHELDTGHWPMFSDPKALSALLSQIASPRAASEDA